jgi:hypothetical protein
MLGDLPDACSDADFSSKARISIIVSSACVTSRSTTVSTVVVTPFSFAVVAAGKIGRGARGGS